MPSTQDNFYSKNKKDKWKYNFSNLTNEFDPVLLKRVLGKSLHWILIFFLFALACIVVYIRYTPRIYEADGVIQIWEEDNANKILEVREFSESNLAAKIEFLRSPKLFFNVLQKLPLKVSYFTEGEILENNNYKSSNVVVDFIETRDNSIVGKKIYYELLSKDSLKIFYDFGGIEFVRNFSVCDTVRTPHFQSALSIVNYISNDNLADNNKFYFIINDINLLTKSMHRHLDISVLNAQAKTLRISFKDRSAVLATDVVTGVINEFIFSDIERKKKSASSVLNFIDSQLDTVYGRLKNSEVAIQSFKKENKVAEIGGVSSAFINRLEELEQEVVKLEIEENLLIEIKNAMDSFQTENDVYQIIPLLIGTSYEGSISRLLDELYNLLVSKEKSLFEITVDNEKVKSLTYQIGIQKKLVLNSIGSIQNMLAKQKGIVKKKIDDIESQFFSLPTKELEFSRLQRIFAINEKYYTLLLEKRTEFSISQAGFVASNEVLRPSVIPKMPISPNKNAIVVIFFVLGIIASFILVGVRYFIHNEICSIDDIVTFSKIPLTLLGVVPKYKKEIRVSHLIIAKNPKSIISETFRSIRSNLEFLSDNPGPKIAAITSTVSGEGKTFIAVNLGGILAYSGKKVVVLDLDMRKPKIHLGFKVDNTIGMSSLLIGRSALDDAIHQSNFKDLDFITAGPVPPNPAELVLNKRMQDILDELKLRYDYIIVDTPPIGLVTDGMPILKQADFPIYIFRYDYSKRNFIQNADWLVFENKLKNLSAVLNGFDDKNKGYGKYGYYSYGYYEEEPKNKLSLKKKIINS